MDEGCLAGEGQQYEFRDRAGQDWMHSWHSAEFALPDGRPHGSGGICFTPEGNVVLVTWPGVAWDFPAGRPEQGEDWRATLDREVLEEACAVVRDATLLGFIRGACTRGEEEGLVLVRGLWSADVTLNPWRPRHETTGRLVVRPHMALEKARHAHNPVDRRWFREALAAKGLA